MNGEMMGVWVTGILKFRPTGKYRDMQNKSWLVHGTSGAFCYFLKYPVDLLKPKCFSCDLMDLWKGNFCETELYIWKTAPDL